MPDPEDTGVFRSALLRPCKVGVFFKITQGDLHQRLIGLVFMRRIIKNDVGHHLSSSLLDKSTVFVVEITLWLVCCVTVASQKTRQKIFPTLGDDFPTGRSHMVVEPNMYHVMAEQESLRLLPGRQHTHWFSMRLKQ